MKNYWLDKKAAKSKVATWDFQTAIGVDHDPLYVKVFMQDRLEELKLQIMAENPQVLGIQFQIESDDSHILPPWNTETYNNADLSGWECDL